MDVDQLSEKLNSTSPRKEFNDDDEDDEDNEDKYLSVEAKEKKKKFADRRKKHYNEFMNIKKARELIDNELAQLEDEEEGKMDISK